MIAIDNNNLYIEVRGIRKKIGQFFTDSDSKKVFLKKIRHNQIHLMQKTKEIGFNAELFQTLDFDLVTLLIGKKPYFATKEEIMTNGRLGRYKDYEPQYFYPITSMKTQTEVIRERPVPVHDDLLGPPAVARAEPPLPMPHVEDVVGGNNVVGVAMDAVEFLF